MPDIPILKQGVRHHGKERWCQGHRDPEIHAVPRQPIKGFNQRNIGLGERLVKPLLFQKTRVFRVADIGQVRVQDDREITFFHGRTFRRVAQRLFLVEDVH